MLRISFHRVVLFILLIPAHTASEDYYPLSAGSVWYYSYHLPEAPPIYHTYRIIADTMVGRQHYVARTWSSSTSAADTATEWLYVSGNDVYKLADLARPDAAIKIAQKSYAAGDRWIDGSGLLGDLRVNLAVSFNGHHTVPAGIFDGTWSAYGTDNDTLAGGLVVIRNSVNHLYADGVGEIRATMVVLGTIHYVELDSFYIAPEAGTRMQQRLDRQADTRQVKRVTILEPTNDIGRDSDRLLCLNGRRFSGAPVNKALPRQRLPYGMLIAIPAEDDRSDRR